jgi:predicted RNase H-like HicB family nuclease
MMGNLEIKNEEDYENAVSRIDELMDAEADTPELDELKSLTLLVEQYENIHYPLSPPNLLSKIKFRLEQLGLINYQVEVVPIPPDEGGGFMARMPQFGVQGIIGDGESPEEALQDLAENQRLRFAQYLEDGLDIPGPMSETSL